MELQVPYPIINYHQPPTGQLPSIPYSSPTAQPPHPYQTRLDLTILEQNVQFYIQSTLSNNTIHSYNSSNRRFLNFCSQFGIHPYPTSEAILCQFAGFLGRQHLKHQTIKCYLSGIRYFQNMQSYHNPFVYNLTRLHYVLQCIKSEEAKQNCPSHQWLPVTPAIANPPHYFSDFDNILLWAAFCLCFFGFLPSGKITIPNAASYDPSTHLNFSNIAVDNSDSPRIMQVRIKASKTDPFHQGINPYRQNKQCFKSYTPKEKGIISVIKTNTQ